MIQWDQLLPYVELLVLLFGFAGGLFWLSRRETRRFDEKMKRRPG
jgi:hypothetical protein